MKYVSVVEVICGGGRGDLRLSGEIK